MKLSSSTLCGCCFCCYCHCWLMMLLMVSSVGHVSPEMSTTTTITTTTKKYTKLNNNNYNNQNNNNNNNNNNNYAYQSTITEFVHLNNKKLTNRKATAMTKTTLKLLLTTLPPPPPSSSSSLFSVPQLPAATITIPTIDYQVKSYRGTFGEHEHETITARQEQKRKQSTATATLKGSTSSDATLSSAITMMTTAPAKLPAPKQIQMMRNQQQPNIYNTMLGTFEKLMTTTEDSKSKRPEKEDVFYTFDNNNSIEGNAVIQEPVTSRINSKESTATPTNYVPDKSNAIVPQAITTTTMLRMRAPDKNFSKNKRKNNEKLNNNWGRNSIDMKLKTRQQHQYHSINRKSNDSSSSSSESTSNNNNLNIDNNNMILRQKTTNTFSLNLNDSNSNSKSNSSSKNNSYEVLIANNNGNNNNEKQQNHYTLTETKNRTAAVAAASLNLTTLLNNNHNITTKISTTSSSTAKVKAINSVLLPTNTYTSVSDSRNRNLNIQNSEVPRPTTTTSTSLVKTEESNSYPKVITIYSYLDDTTRYHYQQLRMPATTLATTTKTTAENRALTTYSPLHEYHHLSQMRHPILLHRHMRQASAAAVEQNEKCRMFIEGDAEKNELYSPDYPNDYPKNINCTRVITAPKGQIIRLDFRNSFHIEEKEECKFDFLEIRDGQYGFSNLIGKYCGTDFPPEITSKERYLWLHFHSDESIEYSGFTAVYEFIDRNRDAPSTDLNCTIEKDGFEGFINASDVPPEIKETVIRNKIPLDCMWRIQVQDKWKIQVKFLDFKLAKPNDCETNFLDIFPEQTVMPLRVKNFCGSAGEGIQSDSNILHMRFYAEQSAINSTFSILYTAFRDRGTASCTEDEYDCEDASCIAANLQCNGRDNCKFRWDEEGCKTEDEGQSEHMIIIITVFGLILGGMIITFLVNCVRKIMRDQKIIREVPVLSSDGIYHIDSFILDAPKAVICVGLQDDYKLSYRSGYEHDYRASGHDNIMSIEVDEDNSSTASFENDSYTTHSEHKNSLDSIEIHENCCPTHNNCLLNETYTFKANENDDANDDDNDDDCDVGDNDENDEMADVKHVFDNDEFIIVPHVAQSKLITSHCNLHSGLMILSHPEHELLSPTPLTTTSDSCNSSPAPSSCNTVNTTNSSADSNSVPAKNAATTATGSPLTTSCFRDDMLQFQCFMQKCAH